MSQEVLPDGEKTIESDKSRDTRVMEGAGRKTIVMRNVYIYIKRITLVKDITKKSLLG